MRTLDPELADELVAFQRWVAQLQRAGLIRPGDLLNVATSIGLVKLEFGEKPKCPHCNHDI